MTLIDIIKQHLGPEGRMICGSKSMYRRDHPDSIIYFNACIYDGEAKQIWWGDLDITLDGPKFEEIAECGEKFYITPEHPYRADFNEVTIQQLEDDKEYVIRYN